jgi:hypothetical protein
MGSAGFVKMPRGMQHGLWPPCSEHIFSWPQGANHTCEALLILINQRFIEHGDLPQQFSVQLDNASSNKKYLVLGFLGIYVILGIFKSVRARFLLENHAHDVYDAFQGIHAKALARAPAAPP